MMEIEPKQNNGKLGAEDTKYILLFISFILLVITYIVCAIKFKRFLFVLKILYVPIIAFIIVVCIYSFIDLIDNKHHIKLFDNKMFSLVRDAIIFSILNATILMISTPFTFRSEESVIEEVYQYGKEYCHHLTETYYSNNKDKIRDATKVCALYDNYDEKYYDSFDIEHIIPVSWDNTNSNVCYDLVNMRISLKTINNNRKNLGFGFEKHSSDKHEYFEVEKEWQGDIARVVFYMHCTYPELREPIEEKCNLKDLAIWAVRDPISKEEKRLYENIYNFEYNSEKLNYKNQFIEHKRYSYVFK